MGDLGFALIALLLVLLNGFFVAAEFAIVKLRQTQADELARTGLFGRVLHSVRGHLDAYLSACQLGITLASLALGWIGEPAFVFLIEPLLHAAGVTDPDVVHGVALASAFTLISFLHIVIGEQAPKSIAIRKPVEVSLWTATPLFVFYWLALPFIWILNGCSLLVVRLLGIDLAHGDEAHSPEELKKVLAASHLHGELDRHEADILNRTLEFGDLTAGDVMRPLAHMISVDVNMPTTEVRQIIAKHRYSRYPVTDGGPDQLIGLLHVKDFYAALERDKDLNLRKVVRDVPFAERDTPAMALFRRFRRGYPHFAIVTDELGTSVGFVTLDHILEALLGRIQDEFQRPGNDWLPGPDGSHEGRGWFSVWSLERFLGRDVEAEEAEEAESVGGLIMKRLDRIPLVGERASFDGFSLEVLEMKGPRIERVRLRLQAPAPDPE